MMRIVLASALTLLCANSAMAASPTKRPGKEPKPDDANKPVESVLDRLEKDLLDQNSQGLSFGDADDRAPALRRDAETKYRFNPSRVSTETLEQQRLKEISTAVMDIESSVDRLASDVQQTRQRVLDEAKLD